MIDATTVGIALDETTTQATVESVWSSLRTFLRRFRGVHKRYLPGYVAMFEWAYNLDAVSAAFFRTLCFPDFSALPT